MAKCEKCGAEGAVPFTPRKTTYLRCYECLLQLQAMIGAVPDENEEEEG